MLAELTLNLTEAPLLEEHCKSEISMDGKPKFSDTGYDIDRGKTAHRFLPSYHYNALANGGNFDLNRHTNVIAKDC